MPTAHRLSFPTCMSHPRSIHLHCHTVHRLLHLPCLGLQQQADQNSQSSVAATGPLPGELTSTTHSLTWRELLTGLTTCLFNHNHLSHLERVLHTGLTTCFFNHNHLSHLERVLHTGLTTCFFSSVPAQGEQQQGSTRNRR
jgi:hypothetical protein